MFLNVLVCSAGDAELTSYGEINCECHLRREFGDNWFQPTRLIIRPHFIVDQYNTSLSIKNDVDIKIKLDFFNRIIEVVKDENVCCNLQGYLVFDFNLNDLRPGADMHIHAALFSPFLFQIVELVDNEDGIAQAYEKLHRVVKTIKQHVDCKVTVKGVVCLPHQNRQPGSIVSPDIPMFYQEELESFLDSVSQRKVPRESIKVTSDIKIALAKILKISFFDQHHPETKEEAIVRASKRCFLQRPEQKVSRFSQIDFNQIKLTETQKSINKTLLCGNTVVWGGYGIGKSVAIVSALEESIKQYKKLLKENKRDQLSFRIMVLSALGLLSDEGVKLSPFLLMVERWIKEVHEMIEFDNHLQVLNYTHFMCQDIRFAMETKTRNDMGVIFSSYLLDIYDLEITKRHSELLNNFDIVVLEETHAIGTTIVEELVKNFQMEMKVKIGLKKKDTKLWIVSSTETMDLSLDGFNVSPDPHVKPENLRNVPAVVKLAEAIDTAIGLERYPSTALLMPSLRCDIDVSYEYTSNDQERLKKIVTQAKKWMQWLPVLKSLILFIDCECSKLYEKLQEEDIHVKLCDQNYCFGEPLFLRHSDPIEAIIACAEWHVLVIHIKINTMNSI